MSRTAVVTPIVVVFSLLASACGSSSATVVSSVPEGAPSAPPPPSSSTAASTTQPPTSQPQPPGSTGGGTTTLQVWFTRGETLWFTTEQVASTRAVAAAAVRALIAGPSDTELAAGVGSVVPAATQLLGIDIADGVATVDLSSEFAAGGGSLSEQMRLAQLVYTLTQFPTVDGVRLRLDGKDVSVFSGEGIVLPDPMRRRDFAELYPVIVVETPQIGDTLTGTVTVRGTANVFEANVSIEIRDAKGRRIASTHTLATCGTGCRGRYSATLRFSVPSVQAGTVVVHDDDAAGTGTPPHQVLIPVTLRPSGS
jgi:germination protein M